MLSLQCICKKSFSCDNESKLPLLLKCGHTFCKKCLEQAYDSSTNEIICPICKDVTSFVGRDKIKTLSPNLAIIALLSCTELNSNSKALPRLELLISQNVGKKTSRQQPKQKCSECITEQADTSCVQCGVNFCGKCFNAIHSSSRVLQCHQGIPLRCGNTPPLKHEDHDIAGFNERASEMVPDIKASLEGSLPVLNLLRCHVTEVEDNITLLRDDARLKAGDIIDHYLMLSSVLQAGFHRKLQDLQQVTLWRYKQLASARENANQKLNQLEDACRDAQLLLNPLTSDGSGDRFFINPRQTVDFLKSSVHIHCKLIKTAEQILDDNCDEKQDSEILQTKFEDIKTKIQKWAKYENNEYVQFTTRPATADELIENEACNLEKQMMEYNKDDDFNNKDDNEAVSVDDGVAKGNDGSDLRVFPVPPDRSQELVYVTHTVSPVDFHVQRHSDMAQLAKIRNKLKNVGKSNPCDMVSVSVGEIYAAQYPFKNGFYRARILEIVDQETPIVFFNPLNKDGDINDVTLEIYFMDYGHRIQVKACRLRPISNALKSIPALAIPCSLVGICPKNPAGWDTEANDKFSKIVAGRAVLMTTVTRESGRRLVDLHKPSPDQMDNDVPMSVRDAFLFLGLALFSSDAVPKSDYKIVPTELSRCYTARKYLKPTDIPPSTFMHVMISDMTTLERFSVQQLGSYSDYLLDMSKRIQKFMSGQKPSDPSNPFSMLCPKVDMPCLARFDVCDMWFRATILEVNSDEQKVKVMFVDYGNISEVHVNDTLRIPDMFMKLPYQAIPCKLCDIITPEEGFSTECNERFMELAGDDKRLLMYIKSVEDDVHYVELYDTADGNMDIDELLSVQERLVVEGLASGIQLKDIPVKTTKSNETGCVKKDADEPSAVVVPANVNVDEQADSVIGVDADTSPLVEVETDDVRSSTGSSQHCSSSDDDSSIINSKTGKLKEPHLTYDVPTGNVFHVKIVNTEGPSVFYVQTRAMWKMGNKLTRTLHKEMKNTDLFGQEDIRWQYGDICAVYSHIQKRWCRGKIIDQADPAEVPRSNYGGTDIRYRKPPKPHWKVRLLDFGRLEMASSECISSFPESQAFLETIYPLVIRCRLVSVMPPSGQKQWSKQTCADFQAIVQEAHKYTIVVDGETRGDWDALPVRLSRKCVQEDKTTIKEDVGSILHSRGLAMPMLKERPANEEEVAKLSNVKRWFYNAEVDFKLADAEFQKSYDTAVRMSMRRLSENSDDVQRPEVESERTLVEIPSSNDSEDDLEAPVQQRRAPLVTGVTGSKISSPSQKDRNTHPQLSPTFPIQPTRQSTGGSIAPPTQPKDSAPYPNQTPVAALQSLPRPKQGKDDSNTIRSKARSSSSSPSAPVMASEIQDINRSQSCDEIVSTATQSESSQTDEQVVDLKAHEDKSQSDIEYYSADESTNAADDQPLEWNMRYGHTQGVPDNEDPTDVPQGHYPVDHPLYVHPEVEVRDPYCYDGSPNRILPLDSEPNIYPPSPAAIALEHDLRMQDTVPVPHIPLCCIPRPDEKLNVHICHVQDVETVFIKPRDAPDPLESLDLTECCPVKNVMPLQPCLARFTEDNLWYRAIVTDTDSTYAWVNYVDYGLAENLCIATDILTLPTKFWATPAQAIMCRLNTKYLLTKYPIGPEYLMHLIANVTGCQDLVCYADPIPAGSVEAVHKQPVPISAYAVTNVSDGGEEVLVSVLHQIEETIVHDFQAAISGSNQIGGPSTTTTQHQL